MITTQEIEHLAKLSRIELQPSEIESLVPEIDSILGYVSQISSQTGETARVIPKLRNVIREDIPVNTPGEYTEKLLDNAPAREGNYLKVKKIL